jgi:tetratricopeptide (TPR) repeat protein
MEFCRLLVREKVYILWNCQSRVNAVDGEMLRWMKRAGCECVQYGVESGSTGMLRVLGKGITPEQVRNAASATRKAGINLSVYLITGVPGESEEDLTATVNLIEDIKPGDGQVSPLAYYPGTSLFAAGVASGAVRSDLFESGGTDAFYVRDDPFVAGSKRILLAKLAKVAQRNCYNAKDFRSQKEEVGYCHATNVLAGEYYEGAGKWQLAEAEYIEIVEREPENPWGWLMLGDLYAMTGSPGKADRCYEKVARLVPKHESAEKRGAENRAIKLGEK